ncbi:putative nuclease HARBI1 [Melitaea cinxia]|uniref:putative nuclease HARBI1 n=1 Tax=Melitaea cinxia TaxID=113334 RepID=UPI001E26FF99|nr:putative nuclease HARBI1 [Melitaea cinxia]
MDRDYFIDDLRVKDEIYEVEDQMPMSRVKHYKICKNPLEELEETEFKLKYRFCKSTAIFIIDMVKDKLAGDARVGFIPPHLKIQDDAGDLGGMSQATISVMSKQVALTLVAHRAQWIKMLQSDAEQNKVIAGFYALCGFRQVIGATDCTHVRIPKVGGDVAQYYINRKGYISINVQVVSNANLGIMDIVAHWRDSTPRIFNECRLKQRFETRQQY